MREVTWNFQTHPHFQKIRGNEYIFGNSTMEDTTTGETDSEFYDNDYGVEDGDDDILHQILINKLMITMKHWRLLKHKMMHGLNTKIYRLSKEQEEEL
jgi:hypothetical protein